MDTDKKERFFAKHLTDLAERAYQGNYPVFTDFMTTKELGIWNRMKRELGYVQTCCWGGHEDCSHKIAGFFPKEYGSDESLLQGMFPIVCFRVQAKSARYAQTITHRDYLGAILNLGMERAKVGDIRVMEASAFVFCKSDFASFVVDNFKMVRQTPVTCQPVEDQTVIPRQQYEEFSCSIASLRLDNVIAAMIGSARKKAVELISQGHVIADQCEQTSVSYSCKDGMIVTIKGYGKYRLHVPEDAVTRKGKQRIMIYKYM